MLINRLIVFKYLTSSHSDLTNDDRGSPFALSLILSISPSLELEMEEDGPKHKRKKSEKKAPIKCRSIYEYILIFAA